MDLFALRPGERFGSWWREVDAEVGEESDSDGEGPRVDRDPTDNHHAAEEEAPQLMLVEKETADELVKVAGARAAAKKRLSHAKKKRGRRGRGGRASEG